MTILAARPEFQLLLSCARTCVDDATAQYIKTLVEGSLDWSVVMQLAIRHGVAPLLYRNLTRGCSHAVPEAIQNQLRSFYQASTLHNLFLTQELLKLLSLFEENGIPVIPFKGPAIATSVYGDLSLRQFSDLDLLVHPEDFLKARDLLLAHGYQRDTPHIFLSNIEVYDQISMRDHGEYALKRQDGLVHVDLHGRLITGRALSLSANFEAFWQRLEPVSLAGTPVLTFCAEDLLLYLCIHGAKELWRRLGWLCDVAELIHTHPSLNWTILIEQAQASGTRSILFLGLSLVRALLDVPLPETVNNQIQTKFRQHHLAIAVKQRLLCETNVPKTVNLAEQLLFSLQITERLEDKVQSSLRMLTYWTQPTLKDQEFLPLPHSLYGLYLVIRPIRLSSKYSLRLLSYLLMLIRHSLIPLVSRSRRVL